MKITLPQTRIAKTRVQHVNVGEVRIGPVQIGRLTLNNVHVQTSTGTAQLRNVHLTLTIAFELDWRVGITISMPDGIPDVNVSDSGTIDLGTLTLGIGLGDLALPGLAHLAFDVPSLPVNNLAAVIGPITNLDLGALLAEQIRAQNTVAPANGFQITGLGLTGLTAQGISVPDAKIAATTIARISGGTLTIPGIVVPNIALPPAAIPVIVSQNVDATSNPVVAELPADVGILAVTLKVTTTAMFHVDELRIDNVSASAAIGEIALTNVALPCEVLNLSLADIGIQSIEVPQLEVN